MTETSFIDAPSPVYCYGHARTRPVAFATCLCHIVRGSRVAVRDLFAHASAAPSLLNSLNAGLDRTGIILFFCLFWERDPFRACVTFPPRQPRGVGGLYLGHHCARYDLRNPDRGTPMPFPKVGSQREEHKIVFFPSRRRSSPARRDVWRHLLIANTLAISQKHFRCDCGTSGPSWPDALLILPRQEFREWTA